MQLPFSSGCDQRTRSFSFLDLMYTWENFISCFVLTNLACHLCRSNVDHKEALENLDLIFLCLDEIIDGG